MRGEAAHEERLRRVATTLAAMGGESLRVADGETLARAEQRLEALEQRLQAWARHDRERWEKLLARAERARAELHAGQGLKAAALEQTAQRARELVERGRRDMLQMDKSATAFERDALKHIGAAEADSPLRQAQLCEEEFAQRQRALGAAAEKLAGEAAQAGRTHAAAMEAQSAEVMMRAEAQAAELTARFEESQKAGKESFDALLQNVETFLDEFRFALKQHQEQRLKSEDGVLQVLENITLRLRELNGA